jgi:hypothetical protein
MNPTDDNKDNSAVSTQQEEEEVQKLSDNK